MYRDLGVRSVAVTDDGAIAAVGGCDGTVRLINTLSWTLVASWNLERPTVDGDHRPAVYVEREKLLPGRGSENESGSANAATAAAPRALRTSYFEAVDGRGAIPLPPAAPNNKQSPPPSGVSALCFSGDGRHLSATCAHAPSTIFIISVAHARLASALVLAAPVTAACWAAGGRPARLAAAGGGASLYLWREDGAAAVRVPDGLGGGGFRARRVAWARECNALLATDAAVAGSFCVVYM
jgi:WD40 repeat protein